MKPKKQFMLQMLIVLFMLGLSINLVGCKSFSNDSSDDSGTIIVDIKGIEKQMGVSSNTTVSSQSDESFHAATVPGATDATDEVKSLLVGAFVVNSRSTPYTSSTAINDAVEENLKDELAGSVNFIKIVDLPVAEDYVEFYYPSSDLSQWQVIAVGLNFAIESFEELGQDEHKDSIVYIGFSENFYKASQISSDTIVDLQMFRACLTNEIKGCATYNDSLADNEPVVVPAVEIIGVSYNEDNTVFADVTSFEPTGVSFPIIVRTDDEATAAETSLKSVLTEIETAASATVTSLTVWSTHTMNDSETSECKNLKDNSSASAEQLSSNCTVTASTIFMSQ